VFRSRVLGDLSYAQGRLKKADQMAEIHLRRFIKSLITKKHTPRRSDMSPIGDLIGQTIRGFLAAKRGDIKETEKSVEALNNLYPDPHYRQRNLLNEALDIASKIQVNNLLDFYQATKTSNLILILPGWRRMIQPKVVAYRKVRGK
jgi:hypothetical protein